jgi:hypothetical protein
LAQVPVAAGGHRRQQDDQPHQCFYQASHRPPF